MAVGRRIFLFASDSSSKLHDPVPDEAGAVVAGEQKSPCDPSVGLYCIPSGDRFARDKLTSARVRVGIPTSRLDGAITSLLPPPSSQWRSVTA